MIVVYIFRQKISKSNENLKRWSDFRAPASHLYSIPGKNCIFPMTPYTIPRHFKDQASPRSTPTARNTKTYVRTAKASIDRGKASHDP